jgi:hypothetical protein
MAKDNIFHSELYICYSFWLPQQAHPPPPDEKESRVKIMVPQSGNICFIENIAFFIMMNLIMATIKAPLTD